MNEADKLEYEALWETLEQRQALWATVLSKLKLELQEDNKNNPSNRKSNYATFLSHCRDRKFNAIAGTVYCPRRNRYIDFNLYFAGH